VGKTEAYDAMSPSVEFAYVVVDVRLGGAAERMDV
jgi:hypothetical protein